MLIISKFFEVSSDALLSLISAIIGGLIATSSQAWVSVQNRENQLRLAALDKRLEAHQQAYTHWRKLVSNATNKDTINKIVLEAQTWWEENCLYLDAKSRAAFYQSLSSASGHHLILKSGPHDQVTKSWNKIIKAGEIIVTGVSLPTIGEFEIKSIVNPKS
ncbi:MAG: hypothetical protein LC108_15580 [Anaerolineales bacterium]|nr:hypothetical protein [Anaerolineales bacterium]